MKLSVKNASHAAKFAVATLILALGFSACNTVAGVGKDVKSTGKAVERSAESAK